MNPRTMPRIRRNDLPAHLIKIHHFHYTMNRNNNAPDTTEEEKDGNAGDKGTDQEKKKPGGEKYEW